MNDKTLKLCVKTAAADSMDVTTHWLAFAINGLETPINHKSKTILYPIMDEFARRKLLIHTISSIHTGAKLTILRFNS